MAAKLLSLNSLLDRKKPKNDVADELAIIKAAAWAWYHHGSGSERKAMSELDVTRTVHAPRPSRYKLEAMSMAREVEEKAQIQTHKSLLDAFEVESISRELESLIESSRSKVANGNSKMKKKKKKTMVEKGFWVRHAVVCGTNKDVVEASVLKGRKLLTNSVPIVNQVKCMPRSISALGSLS
ncbi:hypothetical protein L6164_033056 [Bauhinia variegata]|uniref:Uncharacterized protein n=1 Tax=Bauhinia variegata TaxID=167791 RepID=A0ACB9KQT2_BAUVA|nr:hypothetical protein L6164_033056 [Bauhinia variegata]